MSATNPILLALDVGTVRIGVASASTMVLLPNPLTTLSNSETIHQEIAKLAAEQGAVAIIVGLPRNLDGDDTPQTAYVRDFVARLSQLTELPIHLQDEALTSEKATDELDARGKIYSKADVDALAATYILEDYVRDHGGDVS
ncbi:MAG: putative Holliday junction resolvase [Candidatus Saccharibacteria bacterium]|nr:putative Holliday junction resolvase [Candidatus Saccharibacteria bacterium]